MLLRARRAVLLDCSRGSSADCSLKGAPGACLLADKAGQAQSPADAAEVAGRACWRNHQHGDGTHVGGAACWRRRSQGRGEGAGTFIRSDRPGQQPHPTSPREPAGACKSRPCREPAGPPPALPPALHARAASERLCYKYPKLSLPQAVTAPSRFHPAPSPTCAVIVPRCRPHEPGDYSLVAQIFMHIPLRYLRQHIPLRSLNKTAGSRARTPRMPPPLQICAAHGVKAWELARAKSRDLGTDNYRQEEIGLKGAARTRGLQFCCIINLNTNTTPLSVEIVSYAPNPCLIAPLPRRSAPSPQHICYPASSRRASSTPDAVAIPRPCRPVP